MSLQAKRICYNCGATKTYIGPNGYAQWYHDKNGNWRCSKCRMKIEANPKWHPINHAKESKEEVRIANRRNSRIHGTIKKELKKIPVTNLAQLALHKEYKTMRARDLRAHYRMPPIDTLLKCINKVKENHTSWQPEYDMTYFDIARSELELVENVKKDSELYSILDNLTQDEKHLMQEALDCATNGYSRASIVLGWAAAVYRMHKIIQKMGFETFNKKSQEMVDIKEGRFKNYNARFYVRNSSDVQATVSESNLLWVLEYCEIIDSNQHQRLELCYTMRNTSAHPNSTKITYENVKSFYSDLKSFIFDNEKLKL